jgi:hypothetical protein
LQYITEELRLFYQEFLESDDGTEDEDIIREVIESISLSDNEEIEDKKDDDELNRELDVDETYDESDEEAAMLE